MRVLFKLLATLALIIASSFSEQIDYTSAIVPNEYIISFDGYYNNSQRSSIIKDALRNTDGWKQVFRKNAATFYLSDFSLVQIAINVDLNLYLLLDHPSIKSVTQQRRLTRILKNVNPNHADSPSWNARKLTRSSYDLNIDEPSVKSRKILRAIPKQISQVLQANVLWGLGYRGKGIKVAVFDTGLPKSHPHFKHVEDYTDWTDEKESADSVGHGTFVAGVIASDRECFGIAPDSQLLIFRVFTNQQVSYTSWFLDAFNYAIHQGVDILNLSIGGPDFMDKPFVEKVRELSANNIILVSAIGNDGPLYGTLNNPADQMDVIGVGGINFQDQIATFSSRGMTTHELPYGYGRLKPDIVTYGSSVWGSSLKGGCRSLSGTSVASPVVTGALALLLSSVATKEVKLNPASVKQAIISSAVRLPNANMFEQGHGKLDLIRAYRALNKYKPHASASPRYLDLTECPYMWPYCSQPLYYSAMPTLVNVTILNGMSVSGKIIEPRWEPYDKGDLIELAFSHSERLWPWSGYLAVHISARREAQMFSGVVQGLITLNVTSVSEQGIEEHSKVVIPLKVKIVPTPPRSKRLLWDQYHNLRYPSAYFPRDNLDVKKDPLDWNADHIHTNFKDLYTHLRKQGYFIEVLGVPFTCFDAKNYGALILADLEEEFFEEEIEKLAHDVYKDKLSLIVLAEWYNVEVMKKIQFYDENTRRWWMPVTGGANVPALNRLLRPWHVSFTDRVYAGKWNVNGKTVHYSSGTSIGEFPEDGLVFRVPKLTDQAGEILHQETDSVPDVPVLGFLRQPADGARLAVYGDASCLDSAHMQKDCFWLMDVMLNYTIHGGSVPDEMMKFVGPPPSNPDTLPERMIDNELGLYSKVVLEDSIRPLPSCPSIKWEAPMPRNGPPPQNLFPNSLPMTAPT